MATTHTTPDQIETTVFDAIATFGPERSEVTREATLEQLDIDSLDLAELSQIVEDRFGIRLKDADVTENKTVGDAVDIIVARA
jgi:acyl carrier protein